MNFLEGELIEIGEDKCKVKLTTGDIVIACVDARRAEVVTRLNWVSVLSTWCR
jgi:multiple sugar transport system ATP-binding protein